MSMPRPRTNSKPGGYWVLAKDPGFLRFFGDHSGKFEILPLNFMVGLVAIMVGGILTWSLMKPEVQIRRGDKFKSIDWEKSKNTINKRFTFLPREMENFQKKAYHDPTLDKVMNEIAAARAQKDGKK